MFCKLYQVLFWMIPFKKWQSYIIERHFSTCPRCREMTVEEDTIRPMVVSPQRAEETGPLWQVVRRGIQVELRENVRYKKPLPHWRLAAAVVFIALVLILPFTFRSRTGGTMPGSPVEAKKPARTVIILSAALTGQPAHSYVFQSKSPEMTMIWVTPAAQ